MGSPNVKKALSVLNQFYAEQCGSSFYSSVCKCGHHLTEHARAERTPGGDVRERCKIKGCHCCDYRPDQK